MKLVRVLMVCLLANAFSMSAYSQSFDKNSQPRLGPIVPLGSLPFVGDGGLIVATEPILGPIILIGATEELIVPAPEPIPGDHSLRATLVSGPANVVLSGFGPKGLNVQHFSPSEVSVGPPITGFPLIRVIDQRVAAPTIEPSQNECRISFVDSPDPNVICHQFTVIFGQLAAAGLSDDAARVQEFQKEFQRKHYQNLLIAFKESQLRALQIEVNSLKRDQEMASLDVQKKSQVQLSYQVVMINKSGLSKLFTDAESQLCEEISSDRTRELVDALCERGDAKIIGTPKATVFDGHFIAINADETEDSNPATDGNQSGFGPIPGYSILAKPTRLEANDIRLELSIQWTDLISDAEGNSEPNRQTRRIHTVRDIRSDQTTAINCCVEGNRLKSTTPASDKRMVVLVTHEIVSPMVLEGIAPYRPMPSAASRQQEAPRPKIVEAKAILNR